MCVVRDLPVPSALALLDTVAPRAHDLLGIGLDSAEMGYPPSLFEEVFDRAAQLGLRRVAHAGEEGPPAYVWEAISRLHVDRIDHGIRAAEDPALVAHLVNHRIPLTICPLSNVRLRAVSDLESHPLRDLFDAGVLVTINSDDPAYIGGYVNANYEAMRDAGFTLRRARQDGRQFHRSLLCRRWSETGTARRDRRVGFRGLTLLDCGLS